MSAFARLSPTVLVAGQLTPADIDAARHAGAARIVNNRPDGEEPDQPAGAAIEEAARAAGLDYHAVPVGAGGFAEPQIDAMRAALDGPGTTLAFCRTGTRSTLLWALAQAKAGGDPDAIARAAASAGYDIAPVRFMVNTLAGRASSD